MQPLKFKNAQTLGSIKNSKSEYKIEKNHTELSIKDEKD